MLLTSLDDEQVLGVNVAVLGEVEVLLRDEHALTEEVLYRGGTVSLKLLDFLVGQRGRRHLSKQKCRSVS